MRIGSITAKLSRRTVLAAGWLMVSSAACLLDNPTYDPNESATESAETGTATQTTGDSSSGGSESSETSGTTGAACVLNPYEAFSFAAYLDGEEVLECGATKELHGPVSLLSPGQWRVTDCGPQSCSCGGNTDDYVVSMSGPESAVPTLLTGCIRVAIEYFAVDPDDPESCAMSGVVVWPGLEGGDSLFPIFGASNQVIDAPMAAPAIVDVSLGARAPCECEGAGADCCPIDPGEYQLHFDVPSGDPMALDIPSGESDVVLIPGLMAVATITNVRAQIPPTCGSVPDIQWVISGI